MKASLLGRPIESDLDLEKERSDLQGLIDERGPEYVWWHRQRPVSERMFIRNFLKKWAEFLCGVYEARGRGTP